MPDAAQRDVAQDAMSIAADSMGHDFVAALLQELRSMPDHWARLSEEKQQRIIEGLKEKVRTGIDKAMQILTRTEFAAVQAELKAISWQQGITATLTVPRDALHRHQLCDAQGQKVMVVMASPHRWFGRMDELKAKGDQAELFDFDATQHIPGVDQPAYRRDEDRTASAPASSWDDLKKSLGVDKKPAEGEPAAPPAPEPPSEYRAEGTSAIDRRKEDGEWEPVKLKEIQRGDVVRIPGFEIGMVAKTPSLKAKGGQYSLQVEPEAPMVFGSAATETEEATAELRMLQERLASIGVGISLGALQAFTPEQISATGRWAEAYAADPTSCKIARPLWLPIPEKGEE